MKKTRRFLFHSLLFVLGFGSYSCWAAPGGDVDTRTFDIPRVPGIVIDGHDDWQDGGFLAAIQAWPGGATIPPDDLDARLLLSWSDSGLQVLVRVRDDAAQEYDGTDRLYRKDSVEVFLSEEPGSGNRFQLYVTPGGVPEHPAPRIHFNDFRPKSDGNRASSCKAEVASSRVENGYTIEILLPWENLGLKEPFGRVIGFQLYVNDADTEAGYPDEWVRFSWHPGGRSSENPDQVHGLRLSQVANPADFVAIRTNVEVERGRAEIRLISPVELAGAPVSVWRNGTVLERTLLQADAGRAVGRLRVVLPEPGVEAAETELQVGAETFELSFGDLKRLRALAIARQEFRFNPYCFTNRSFPDGDFARPLEAEKLIGPYKIDIRYFDSHYNLVRRAGEPGLYGAVIDIIPEKGMALRRYRTLYRQPERVRWAWYKGPPWEGQIRLPRELGIPDAIAVEESEAIMDCLGFLLEEFREENAGMARLLGGLSLIPEGESTDFSNDARARDSGWWIKLKRKLGGMNERSPAGFACPRPAEGPSAPVVRRGTLKEAGMLPGTAERIDELCREWVATSGVPFSICFVRRGIIVHHAAYGEVDGGPMTVDTPRWLASITKLLSGTCLMMLVDHGIVDLDEPVRNWLPDFRRVKTAGEINVRDLFRHTSGLPELWPPDMHDLEPVMAELAPLAKVRDHWEYNTAVSELGGKLIEMASGEVLAGFYKRHLFEPLGCGNTWARRGGGDAWSTSGDLARIGQMLLNRGAYGEMRFFSEETFERMLPTSLSDLPGLSQPWPREAWGIGVAVMADEFSGAMAPYRAFGRNAFGHGAASSSTFVIDPERDMILTVVRNRGGEGFREYARELVELILASVIMEAEQ